MFDTGAKVSDVRTRMGAITNVTLKIYLGIDDHIAVSETPTDDIFFLNPIK